MARANASGMVERLRLFSGPADIAGPRLALILAVFFLSVIGLVAVFSASSIEALDAGKNPLSEVGQQALILVVSVLLCVGIVAFIPYERWLGRLLDAYWSVAVLLLLLTAAIGTIGLGAQRWLSIGPVSFQPSELAKVALVLMMARIMYTSRMQKVDFKRFWGQVAALIVMPLSIILFLQSDLGTTAICLFGIFAVVYLAGVPMRSLAKAFPVLIVVGLIGIFVQAYRGSRFNFINPEQDYFGAGYQLSRSIYAFGEGGLFGVGLGNSTERYLYLPEAETDFIFAIIGEELGLMGALAVLAAFVVILWAGLRIARSAPDLFGSMIAGGCTVMLVAQAFINIGCVLSVLPTTGKPLPFVSSGGTSLLGSFITIAIILSVSMASNSSGGIYDRRRENLRVVHAFDFGPARSSSADSGKSSGKKKKDRSGKKSGAGRSARAGFANTKMANARRRRKRSSA